MVYWFVRNLCRILLLIFFRLRIEGSENIPKTGRLIVAANHASMMDPVIVGSVLKRKVHYMAKEELFSSRFSRWFFNQICVFPVARSKGDRGAIRKALELLDEEKSFGIFPEGTRTEDGRLGEPQPGMAMIASKSMSPILPVGIINTYNAMPKGSKFPKFVPITVRIGRLLSPQELGLAIGSGNDAEGSTGRMESRKRLEKAGRLVMDKINELLQEGNKN